MAKVRKETPQQIAAKLLARKRQDFEAVGLSPEAADLQQNEAVQITREGGKRDGRTVDKDSARRIDGIEAVRGLLKGRDAGGCYDALRRLERDMIWRRGEGDRGRILERVDGDSERDRTDKIVQAGLSCDYIASRLSRRDWWLLNELIVPSREHEAWRGAVFYVTGEQNEMAQGACVRSACVNLRDAYDDLERARARRAA